MRALAEKQNMHVQMIERDGEPEYAVLPWNDYQALLQAASAGLANSAPDTPQLDGPWPLRQLTSLRKRKGLSREDLARAVGISPHHLAMIENTERHPDPEILRALAWVLDISGWEERS
jgi:DNA-binding XRE family transcriptional regulator